MTPTREQVIEWAEEAGITSDDAACQIHDLTQLANLAHAAGRDQGLREAKEVCEAKAASVIKANTSRGRTNAAAMFSSGLLEDCAAAIEQLRASA